MTRLARALAVSLALSLPLAATPQTATSTDAKVQPPQLGGPQRASLAGQLASVTFGPADLSRGAFTLPSPFEAPAERGKLLASVFPGYSADAGIGEWGIGWATSLAITRSRLSGALDWATDELTGPFGRMVKGTDGYWYPAGMGSKVRASWAGDVITAWLPDGTELTFGGTARVATPKGTYAWHLTEARTATGRKTRIEWAPNASGRLFATSVWYGGVGDDAAYRIDLEYEPLAQPFEDYRSEQLLALDRRVKVVRIHARRADTGTFAERWRYELGYDDEGFGPGFYLARVERVFAGGAREPATTYTHYRAADRLASAQLVRNPKVDPLVALYSSMLQPNRSVTLDEDDDGLPDLEWSYDYRLYRQTASGFTAEPLPPPPPGAATSCRGVTSTSNVPRSLAQLRAGVGDDTTYVVSMRTDAAYTYTYLTACERDGFAYRIDSVDQQWTQRIPGNWVPGATVRIADLNRDHLPDVVRLQAGLYRVLPNTSPPGPKSAGAFSFGASRAVAITPSFTPDTAWVHDFNGDGLPDLIGRYASGVVVWFGKGNLDFVTAGRAYQFISAGSPLLLGGYAIAWIDANKDGLTDAVLSKTSGNQTYLFMNRGTRLEYVPVPGLQAVDATLAKPVAADLAGTGNAEVAFSNATQGWSIALDGPEVGLMARADDGKGTTLSFRYGRSDPSPGARQRQAVVTRIDVESSGYDAAFSEYAYEAPAVHRVGRFLLGYGRVTRVTPILTQTADFLNEDDTAGLLVRSRTHDSNAPFVDAFESREFEDAPFQGTVWKRPRWEVKGFVDAADAVVAERTDYLTWARDFCAETVSRTGASGGLTTTRRYVHPPGFGQALSCVWDDAVEEGARAGGSPDFRHATALTLNAVGLVQKVESVARDGGRWTLQDVAYRPDWLIDWIAVPGKGRTSFGYDPATLLPRSTTTPDGVVVEVVARDPLSHGILELRTTRGTARHGQFFRYDGQERLEKSWDDLGLSSEATPATSLSYQPATAAEPAATTMRELVDPARASARTAVELTTAAGEPLATASRIPEGWAFGPVVTRSRTTAQTRTHLRDAVAATVDPTALDLASLLAGAREIASSVATAHGHPSLARTAYHEGVERQLAAELTLSDGLLRLVSVENGSRRTVTWMDAAKRVVARDDEAGVRYAYAYDALGRLRAVGLPDGASHRVAYDDHGRVWRIEREGLLGTALVTIEHVYDPVTGLPAATRYLSGVPGSLARSVAFAYDGIGRPVAETHADAASGVTRTFRYFYDGATPAEPDLRTTLGLLTGVSGDGFTRTLEYRADGLLSRRRVTLDGWRTVEAQLGYLEAGVVGSRTVRVLDAAGAQLSASTQTYVHDAFGRLEATELDGARLATYAYGPEGELRGATFPGPSEVTLEYDGLTRRFTGSTLRTPQHTAAAAQAMNARGLVDAETFTAGTTSVSRAYRYGDRRFLESASDASATYGYEVDPSGLPRSITTDGVVKPITWSGATLVAGSVVYTFDALGRTATRGDLVLAYGPDGQLESAARDGATWSFVNDESGRRLLKRAGGVPVAGFVEEGYLDADGLTERVQVAGRTVGLLRNGVFSAVATDARGTVLAEATGAARLASPFGWRSVHPSTSAALDYVEKGFDADLGLVRMGVRDYDPEINRFTTPDPLLLAEPGRTLERESARNLYAYAAGDPLSFVDPHGTTDKPASPQFDRALWAADKAMYMMIRMSPNLSPAGVERAFKSGEMWKIRNTLQGMSGEMVMMARLWAYSGGSFQAYPAPRGWFGQGPGNRIPDLVAGGVARQLDFVVTDRSGTISSVFFGGPKYVQGLYEVKTQLSIEWDDDEQSGIEQTRSNRQYQSIPQRLLVKTFAVLVVDMAAWEKLEPSQRAAMFDRLPEGAYIHPAFNLYNDATQRREQFEQSLRAECAKPSGC
ncbi:MAG TPA: RHS repeat-associated core domain-containing protein [Anaeromyxobacter sp.]|nr:RHS repeat-associated core domain-containing protein [Anaeromyxobacter sp.]